MLPATATFGIAAVASYWLAFFPPGWYAAPPGRRRALRAGPPQNDVQAHPLNDRYPAGAEVSHMMAFAGVFYLVSTYAFILFCIAIGIRLVRLSRRTGARPELFLGSALCLMGGVGYGALITLVRARGFGEAGMAWLPAMSPVAKGLHDLGVLCMITFVVNVFRPTEAWARALAGAMAPALLVGYVGHTITDGFRDVRLQTPWYWLGFGTIGTVPIWAAIESFRYHGPMRKRRRSASPIRWS